MSTLREQILTAAVSLLEKQGYPATGLNEIVHMNTTSPNELTSKIKSEDHP